MVNIFFAITLLFSYLAVHISPDSFALPAFFGLAYPYLLLINIILIIVWAMRLKPEAFISVAVIAVGINHFTNYIQLFRQKASKDNTFKVLSYNVHMFNYFESSGEKNSRKKIFEYLKSRKPDIFCLQEFFLTGDPSTAGRMVSSETGLKYYSHVKMIASGKERYYGIATFSRYPIIRKGEIVHKGSSSLSIFSDVVIEGDTFRIYNNHLQSFRLKRMERSFFEEMTTSGDGEKLSEVKNLSSRLKRGFINRAEQAEALRNHISKSPFPVIVVGDFNDTPVSFTYRKIRKGLNDSFVKSGYGAGFTYRGNYPPNRIDYILYDDNLESGSFEISRIRYSDHYPIVAYLRKKVRKEAS